MRFIMSMILNRNYESNRIRWKTTCTNIRSCNGMAEIHKEELIIGWNLLQETGKFNKIQPLV